MIIKIINRRGDTIIEVLLAMALLTMILFTSWGLVNRSTQISLTARKRIEMVNQLKEQAEIIKNIYAQNEGKPGDFKDAVLPVTISPSPGTLSYDEDFCNTSFDFSSPSVPGSFYLKYDSGGIKSEDGVKKVNANSAYLVWVQKKESTIPDNKYIEFYVRGCWQTAGGTQKTDNSQIILRLNT